VDVGDVLLEEGGSLLQTATDPELQCNLFKFFVASIKQCQHWHKTLGKMFSNKIDCFVLI